MFNVLHQGLRKREPRVAMILSVRMKLGTIWVDAIVHNVSSRGALVQSKHAPKSGTYVEIRHGTSILIGRVMWRKDQFFGIRTQDKIDIGALQKVHRRLGDQGRSNRMLSETERRSHDRVSREGDLARKIERAKELTRLFQFIFIVAVVAGAAIVLGVAAFSILQSPASLIENALAARP